MDLLHELKWIWHRYLKCLEKANIWASCLKYFLLSPSIISYYAFNNYEPQCQKIVGNFFSNYMTHLRVHRILSCGVWTSSTLCLPLWVFTLKKIARSIKHMTSCSKTVTKKRNMRRGGRVKNNNKTKGKRRDDTSHQKIPTNLTQSCKNMITQNKKTDGNDRMC